MAWRSHGEVAEMRTMVAVGMAALVSGCALESGEGEPAAGEAQEGATSFTETFAFHEHAAGQGLFVVRAGGSVTVAAHATWNQPGKCTLPTFEIALARTGQRGSEGRRVYPTSGATTIHVWKGLGGGLYYLVFESANADAGCELAGAVRVSVRP